MGNKMNYLILVLTAMIWGSLYVFSRIVLPHVPAMVLVFLRFAVASVLLLAWCRVRHIPRIKRRDMPTVLLVAAVPYYLSNTCLQLGIQYSNASFSSLINGTNPILISVFAVLLLGERMSRRDIAALCVSVLGAFIIIGHPNGTFTPAGILGNVAAALFWSFGMIYIKKLTAVYDPIRVTGSGMGIAALLSGVTSIVWLKLTGKSVDLEPDILLPLLYVCVVCTAVSHLMWNMMLKRMDATVCASVYPIQPLTSMLLGVLFLGEKLTAGFLVGAAMILAGMMMHTMPGRRREAG